MRIAVLGAGVCGLVAARRLARAGHAVDVYERWPGLGGQVATLEVGGGHRLERYYHHLFTSDAEIGALAAELGVEIEWLPSPVAVFSGGRQWPLGTPGDLLRFGPLRPPDRVRMGLALLALRHGDPRRREDTTARAWVTARMGARAWEVVWGPMLRQKFGARAGDITMAWLQSKIALRRQRGARASAGERLGYPRGSFQALLDALAADVAAHGGAVHVDRPAARLDAGLLLTPGAPASFRRGHDPAAFAAGGAPERYDAVLATLPSDVFLALAGGLLPDPYAERLRAAEYHTALCLLLELDRPFSPYYWTTIADARLPFAGVVEQTNLVDAGRYDGRRFLYVANYVEPGDPVLGLDAGALLDRYTPGLRALNPAFDPAWVRDRWLHREPAAQPIVAVGYRERIPPLQTGVPGLVLANTTQIYPEDRGTNYAVRLGEQAAAAVLAGQRAT